MARIAFILLCHKDPGAVIDQARRLTAAGDCVSIHFDGHGKAADYQRVTQALEGNSAVVFAEKRLRCGWGEWSLVAATISALRAAVKAFPDATHFYLLSGDCMPIKSAEYAHAFLDRDDCDYIESVDFYNSGWIKTGLREERLCYRHYFNERKHKWLFDTALMLQKRLGIRRQPPADLEMRIGSQWWCLRRSTVQQVLAFCETRDDVMRFFSTTWIPDETFFQTVVPHVIPANEIRTRTLTFLLFTDYGMPVTFYNDQHDLLLRQDYLFARKISSEAHDLRKRLGVLWQAPGLQFAISAEGAQLFRFLTGRGRVGQRFAPRFWETEIHLGRDHNLLLVIAKKWHIAKRLTAAIRARTDIAAVDYLFDEEDAGLPDMGGAKKTIGKRHRHRRALLRGLFEQFDSRKVVICLDPSARDTILDLTGGKWNARVLLIETDFDQRFLRDHSARMGLAGPEGPDAIADGLLMTVRRNLEDEAEQLRDMPLKHFYVIDPHEVPAQNAARLAEFLGVPVETALEIMTPDILTD